MVTYIKNSTNTEFIIGTERELVHRLERENPNKRFYHPDAVCPQMKRITLDKVITCLKRLEPKISLPDKIIADARIPLEKMIKIGRGD
jgi:quinolinate synthase